MKVKYFCDECGKSYDTEKEANACELSHADVREKEKAMSSAEDEICRLIDEFYKKYDRYPVLRINGKNGYGGIRYYGRMTL